MAYPKTIIWQRTRLVDRRYEPERLPDETLTLRGVSVFFLVLVCARIRSSEHHCHSR